MKYKNKIVLITGSGSGIGKAAALAFSKEGGTIIVSDINEINGLKTVSEIIKNNDSIPTIKELLLSSEIYLPIIGFIFLIFLTIILKKFFYKN